MGGRSQGDHRLVRLPSYHMLILQSYCIDNSIDNVCLQVCGAGAKCHCADAALKVSMPEEEKSVAVSCQAQETATLTCERLRRYLANGFATYWENGNVEAALVAHPTLNTSSAIAV